MSTSDLEISMESLPIAQSDQPLKEALSSRVLLRRRALSHVGLMTGSIMLGLIVLAAVFGPMLVSHDPFAQNLAARLQPPIWVGGTMEHILGTDNLGRDYLARLLYGARISLIVGFFAALVGSLVGVTLGVCAGYFGGFTDKAISYLLTCKLALPQLLLAMALVFLIGPSLVVVICVIGLLHWSYYLVVTRAAVMRVRELDYIASARAIGSGRLAILWHEVLPNIRSEIIVIFTLEMGTAILSAAALSFLGVGIPSPTPAWGLMIATGRQSIFFDPWLTILPGVGLFLLVMAVNLLGDGLRDVLSPEGRN